MVEILRDDATLAIYSTDNSIYQVRPDGVALPSTTAQIAELLASNHRSAQPKPLVARGGGTGTNGQSLTDGLVVDLKRNLNRIISIDPDRLEAVVQPGVVTAQLNAALAEHRLFWAPHTSTLNRATVGGMISTDAAGKGSLIHGRAHRHVLSLDVLLADGTPFTAEPTPIAEAERIAAQGSGPVAELWRALLDLPVTEGADFGFPELARGFSGYGIDRLRQGDMINPIALICGAEGTLAVITEATIRLTPLPTKTALLVASYDSFGEALEDAVELRDSGPTAIECFDETTLERGRSSPAWPALGAVVGEHRGAVLLLEYSIDPANGAVIDPAIEPVIEPAIDLAEGETALAATGRSRAVKALTDPADQASAWKVRADAVGLLAKVATGGPERSARPTAFVEDCAVPVPAMSDFIAGFRATLDAAGVSYGMFGHADVGCVHVRPALDLTDPEHETMVRSITDSVVALLKQHGGVLWGEHGRGFRGDSVEQFLPAETIAVMRQVKTAFDPNDLLNPGKLYRPAAADDDIVAVDAPPLRGQADRQVPVSVRRHFDSAFACNGNGLCHHYGETEVMCPSYKASGDPALSPRGRADLLRVWLADQSKLGGGQPASNPNTSTNTELEDAIAENLHQCLSCSACSGHCPVEVDIPEMKSRFFERYYENRRRPLAHAVLSRFEQLATVAARTPRLAGLGAKPAGRALGLVDLPAPKPFDPPASMARFDPKAATTSSSGAARFDVVIMPDVFTSSLEPATLHGAVRALESVGLSVAVAPFIPSGKFDHVKGKRAAFKKWVTAQDNMVRSILTSGAQPVVIEPAIALLHGSEYRHMVPDGRWDAVRHLAEVLDENRDQLPKASEPQTINLLAHCTEQATAPTVVAAWQRVLTAAGHTVNTPGIGCCGMAGIFGHEAENQTMSRQLWDMTWAEPVADTAAIPVATGYSCRSQASRFGDRSPVHPVAMLTARR